jgi:hypothetical protein
MKVRTTERKKARQSVNVDIDEHSEEENSDEDDNEDKEMAPVGSIPPK